MGLPVRITVKMGARVVPLDEVRDARVSSAFRRTGQDVGQRLEAIRCPEHGKTATDVRLQFDAKGGVDLQYGSCCSKLGEAIGKALG